MADEFDPYREALVVETGTIWPDEFDDWEPSEKRRVEERLHAEPQQVAHLEYVRLHSGFRRQITVTQEDVARLE
jgi:hypothetical protein